MRKVGSTYGTMTVGISNPAQTNIYIWCRVGCEKKAAYPHGPAA